MSLDKTMLKFNMYLPPERG